MHMVKNYFLKSNSQRTNSKKFSPSPDSDLFHGYQPLGRPHRDNVPISFSFLLLDGSTQHTFLAS